MNRLNRSKRRKLARAILAGYLEYIDPQDNEPKSPSCGNIPNPPGT